MTRVFQCFWLVYLLLNKGQNFHFSIQLVLCDTDSAGNGKNKRSLTPLVVRGQNGLFFIVECEENMSRGR